MNKRECQMGVSSRLRVSEYSDAETSGGKDCANPGNRQQTGVAGA